MEDCESQLFVLQERNIYIYIGVSFAMSHFESPKIDTQLSFSSSLQRQIDLVRGEVMQTPAKKVHTVDVQQNPNLGVNNSVLRPID